MQGRFSQQNYLDTASGASRRRRSPQSISPPPPTRLCVLSCCYTTFPLIMVSSLNGMSVGYSLADNTMESPTRLDENEEQGGLFVSLIYLASFANTRR
ncbi:hypothetical protein ACQJBY_000936 [Aegilops geniculata]